MIWLYIISGLVIIFGIVVFRGAPYVPSHRRFVHKAFTKLYKLGPSDLLVDIGSGDGLVLRQAAKLGAPAVGYEINLVLVLLSRLLSRHEKLVSIKLADYWTAEFPDETTVVYVFGVTRDAKKTVRKITDQANRLGRSLAVISYGAELPGLQQKDSSSAHHLYVIRPLQPADA